MLKMKGKLVVIIAACFVSILFLTSYAPLRALAEPVFAVSELSKQYVPKVSELGIYSGYSQQLFTGAVRTSSYVTVRDGTKLAMDLYRPADKSGAPIEMPLPVIWNLTPYGRRGGITSSHWYWNFVKYGYVIAVVDVRGRGSSCGTHMGQHMRWEAFDGYDITEWLAAQPFCNGMVGMFGCSYTGINQLMVTSTRPPHLKAIFSGCHDFNKFDSFYYGGIYQDVQWDSWAEGQEKGKVNWKSPPVDEDGDLSMLRECLLQHYGNVNEAISLLSMPYRNMYSNDLRSVFWNEASISTYIKEINRSGVAISLYGGWWDPFTKDIFIEWKNLKDIKRLIMSPAGHCAVTGPGLVFDLQAEMLRWFDYYLKGIDNGIKDEPALAFYPVGVTDGQWRFEEGKNWPPSTVTEINCYLGGGRSGSVSSVNDGILTPDPLDPSGKDNYTVDYTCSTGSTNVFNRSERPSDLTYNDVKALTYTTPPLASDIEVTGTPMLHLFVSSTAKDGDFFAYLEDVDAHGWSNFVVIGVQRASTRTVNTPQFNNLGIPWYGNFREDVAPPLSGEPVEMVIDLAPISYVFKAGHRIRLVITGADISTIKRAPKLSPPPTISVYHKSYITLPITAE